VSGRGRLGPRGVVFPCIQRPLAAVTANAQNTKGKLIHELLTQVPENPVFVSALLRGINKAGTQERAESPALGSKGRYLGAIKTPQGEH
jgi:hypothetical protein